MEHVRLKDVCTLINGRAYKQEELLSNGKYPVLRVGNFFSDKDFYYSDLELDEDKYCDNGDLLFAWSASFGPKIWTGEKVIYHYHIWKMVLSDRVDKEYLYYYLLYLSERIKAEGHGGIMIHTTKAEMEEREILLPSLEQQKEFVRILNRMQTIIQNRKLEVQKLDDLIKARFVEMFDSGNYPQVTISELVSGKVSSAKKCFNPDDVIKYIDIASIDNKRNVMTGYTEYVLSEAPSRAQQHIIKGDIVISTVRPNLRNVAITEYDDENLVASSGFCVLRASKCLPEYLLAIVCSDKFTNDMTKVVTGANYPAIKDSDVMNYIVSCPPLEAQRQFAVFVKQVDKSKSVVQESLDETQLLFDSLMQKYFG